MYNYSRHHQLIARFEMWEDELTLKLLIRWNFAEDVNWNKAVAAGSKKPIDTSKLENKHFLNLKRGVNLKKRHLEVLRSQIPTVLGLSFQQGPQLSGKVMGLVNGVMADENLKGFLSEVMEGFEIMSFEVKMNTIAHLLDEVYKDIEPLHKNDLLFLFTNKALLVFGLFNYYLKL